MSKRIIFIGAGAIGSYIGGFLAHDGHDVTIVDPWPEQVEKVRADGIDLSGPHDPFNARPNILHIHEAQMLERDFEIGFVAMKSYDTEWSARFIDRFVRDDGYVVSAQNCWNDPTIADIFGQERSVGLIMSSISVALWEAGSVERGSAKGSTRGHNVFRAGEHDGNITPRTGELAEILSVIDASEATSNLWGERWSKLSQNSMGNPVQAMSGLGSSEVMAMPDGRAISIHLAREGAKVGIALGFDIPKFGGETAATWADSDRGDVFESLDAGMTGGGGGRANWRSSMAQDIAKHRRSEVDFMNGYIVGKGREAGVPTPVHAAVVDTMQAVDSGEIEPSPVNITNTLKQAGLA